MVTPTHLITHRGTPLFIKFGTVSLRSSLRLLHRLLLSPGLQFATFVILSLLSTILIVSNLLTAMAITSLNIASQWLTNSTQIGQRPSKSEANLLKELTALRKEITTSRETNTPQ